MIFSTFSENNLVNFGPLMKNDLDLLTYSLEIKQGSQRRIHEFALGRAADPVSGLSPFLPLLFPSLLLPLLLSPPSLLFPLEVGPLKPARSGGAL